MLTDVSWEQYESLLELFSDRRLRFTYDRGTLVIMSPSSLHEWYKEVLANLVRSLAAGLKIDYVSKVLPCGHYTTGETPYKYMDGWYLGSFVYHAFKALREEGVGTREAALSSAL